MGKKRKAVPLAPPPFSQSRKKARQTTTLFHRLTTQRDVLVQQNKDTSAIDKEIESMGGRREYQRASQISTSFFSTSKWVIGSLASNGWLYGVRTSPPKASKGTRQRRTTRLLEIGAINTELLDAAQATSAEPVSGDGSARKKYNISVRAIDLHAMHNKIEEMDFLRMDAPSEPYDVIVCSMVLNCVTTPSDRGRMINKIFACLLPNGLCFLTIPKTCLELSRFLNRQRFEELLEAAGLRVLSHAKDSPKVAFFQLERKPRVEPIDPKWTKQPILFRGKKYRNEFAVTLSISNT